MKMVEGIIYTRDMKKLAAVLEAMGLIVQEIVYDSSRTARYGIFKGIAYVYSLLNSVKIRTVIGDEQVGTLMETLHSFGNCKFVIFPEEQICLA